jgi:enoyl-CoA hydratase/carnithine racemase
MEVRYETLEVKAEPTGIVVLTLNRPEVHNAFNTQMGRELRSFFQPLKFTPGALRCIVITGAGDQAFCAGGDLKERRGMSDDAWRLQHAIFEEAFYAVMECSIPVIAAVNGAAFAGGCELALAADFVYAAHNARFAMTEVTLGIMPGVGGTQNLPRAVGTRRAKEILLTGRPFTAQQAHEWGMVNAIHPQAEVLPAALATAECIAANAPIAVRQVKKSVHYGEQMDVASALAFEVQAYERMIATEDRREGIEAFNERRKPNFKGR